jgi:magnesium transporter
MISTYTTQNKMIWIDLENPTREEVREVMNTYNLTPEVAEDLIDPTIRTRADIYKDYMYFVLHFPLHTHKKHHVFNKRTEELDFVIGKDFLITVHYSPIETLVSFAKSFEADTILNHERVTRNPGSLFVHILYRMYKAVQEKVDDIHTTLNVYEESIFAGKEREIVFELSALNRVLIYFQQALSSHKDILSLFERSSLLMFGKDFESYIDHITQEYNKATRATVSAKEYADELRKTNNSLLSTKQNEIMKTLTVINFIILPLSVITGLFGMNVDSTPLSGSQYDFWIVVLAMIIITLISTSIFKKKNWL